MPARLREGIDAAKRGDKLTARRLLTQVLSVDGNNELALMWMASVVESLDERRFYLERSLQLNPDNARAREALRRLGVTEPNVSRRQNTAASSDYARGTSGGGGINLSGTSNVYLIAAAVVAFVVIAIVVAALVSSLRGATIVPPTEDVQATFASLLNNVTQTPHPRQPPADPNADPWRCGHAGHQFVHAASGDIHAHLHDRTHRNAAPHRNAAAAEHLYDCLQ